MMAALALNLHQERTGGGAIGLDPQSQLLVFSEKVMSSDGPMSLLPPTLQAMASGTGRSFQTIFKPDTGLAASVVYVHSSHELILSFGGFGSQGGDGIFQQMARGLRQALQAASNLMGLSVPTIFEQTSQLTSELKAHVEAINPDRTPESRIELPLGGHSMGGGMATHATLRNDVPAIVTAPMRLGYAMRSGLCAEGLQVTSQRHRHTAQALVTEVVVKGDWVADNRLACVYGNPERPTDLVARSRGAIGHRYLLPTPTPDQIRDRGHDPDLYSIHADVDLAVQLWGNSQQAT